MSVIDRLAATRMTEASSQDELIDTLQSAVTELQRTSDSQKRTIEETEKQVEVLQLIKSDHNNMVRKCRVVFLQCIILEFTGTLSIRFD